MLRTRAGGCIIINMNRNYEDTYHRLYERFSAEKNPKRKKRLEKALDVLANIQLLFPDRDF